ncbi:MAG: hypothetical protein JRD68_16220 [Deltaproteobacteria bacterium]|nr:hypothetical protein [Deltaproteobacteria bacterium]
MRMTRNRFDRVRYPDGIVVILDHAAPALNVRAATVLPVQALRGSVDMFEEGSQLEFGFENSLVKNLTTGQEAKSPVLSPYLINIVINGGRLEFLKSESGSPPEG